MHVIGSISWKRAHVWV